MKRFFAIAVAIITLGLGGAVVAQTIGAVSNGYIEEGNLVRPGNIIKTITMSNRGQDASTCRAACDADSNCSAYTYKQTAPNRKPVCHLRLIALPQGAKRDHGYTQAVSGTKLSYIPDVHSMTPHAGRAMRGGDVSRQIKMTNEDPVACSYACSQDANCSGFTYFPPGGITNKPGAYCRIFTTNGTLTSRTQNGFLSGTKGVVEAPAQKTNRRPVVRPSATPSPRPTLSPTRRPIIERKIEPQITVPDQGEALSDDEDAQFPGEMLQPDD